MEELGKIVHSTDLIDRNYGQGGVDFLQKTTKFKGDIVTNPPYSKAQEFCEKAIELTNNKVAMFLKLTFLEGQKRRKFFEEHPPTTIYVYSSRRKCALNGDFKATGSSASCYAWFVWQKNIEREPVIRWIN